jgi:hypothetical protein
MLSYRPEEAGSEGRNPADRGGLPGFFMRRAVPFQWEENDMGFTTKDWESLVIDADEGLRGRGNLVEALRRMDKSATRLARVNIVLSIIMVLSGIIQVVWLFKL